MSRQIPITRPVFGPEEMAAVQRPLERGWVVQGPLVKEFEERFSAFTGAPHSIASSSCTTALHLVVAALGLTSGQEVIVPAFTWVSTANVVEYMGAKPVFCDIDLYTYNIDVEQIRKWITKRTVGMIPVHLFGLCAEMAPLLELAREHHLWVVEDAACAFGARYEGKHAGLFGNAGCFSFHPRKAITTGEGGMIITEDSDLDRLCRILRDHGASRTDFDRHHGQTSFLLANYDHLGYNYRMTDLQGALGCAQMDRASWVLSERARVARTYDEMLADLDWLRRPVTPEGYQHGFQSYVCLFCPEEPTLSNVEVLHRRRNELMAKLEERGIATRQGTHAPIALGYYAKKYGLKPGQFPHAYLADRLTLALPLYPQMNDEEQDYICRSLRECYAQVIA
ncbi:MAG: DegT/DnrJ/EryC1/StrS family aminotransferase [candidate division NC10 bacterium]|nr:DegT/DnrJ/EryC1/StrS family aminotransferase [candidate division NC10 bacterium]